MLFARIIPVIIVVAAFAGCKFPALNHNRSIILDSSVLRIVERRYNASTFDRIVMLGTNVPTTIHITLTSNSVCSCESDDFFLSVENISEPARNNIIKEITVINDVRHKRWMIWKRYEKLEKEVYHGEYPFGETTDGIRQELRLKQMKGIGVTLAPNWYDW